MLNKIEENFKHAVEIYNNAIQKIMNNISVEIDISSEQQQSRPKLFISLPMRGKTETECKKTMNEIKERVEEYFEYKVKLLNSWLESGPKDDDNINEGMQLRT